LTAFLIDVALIGTVVFCAWRGYRNGLIRGVFGVVALIASLLVANIAAQAYADEAKGLLMPFASGIIESTMLELRDEGIEYQELAYDHELYEDEDFGAAFITLRHIGLPERAAEIIAENSLIRDYDDLERAFSDIIAERLTSAMSYIAVFGIAFLLMAIAFAVIGNLVGFIFALPGLRLVDIIAGAALGLIKGLVIVYTIAVIMRYFGLLMPETLEGTIFLRYLINNNPIANMLGV